MCDKLKSFSFSKRNKSETKKKVICCQQKTQFNEIKGILFCSSWFVNFRERREKSGRISKKVHYKNHQS